MWPALLPLLSGLLDKVLPDPQAAAAAKLEALRLAQAGELAQLDAQTRLALGQVDVNKAEAGSGNAFASSWRPSIGYVCAVALAWDTVLRPMLTFGLAAWGKPVPPLPTLSSDQLYSLLFGLLGLGGLRTVEKVKGAAT